MKPIFFTALSASVLLAACVQTSGTAKPETNPQAEERVQIYKSDGAQQCYGGGTSPAAMQRELQGIRVYAAGKSVLRGVMFPAVCGGGTGSINVYTIAARDLPEAGKRGFMLWKQKD